MVEEEKFYAWLDGELAREEAAKVEAAVAADPELSRLAEEHRAMMAGLRSAFAEIDRLPVPERLTKAIEQDGKLASLAEARSRRASRPAPAFWAQAAALAATLALGVFAGNLMSGGSDPIKAEHGRLIASADLDRALDKRLASAPADKGARIGLTFRNRDGAVCRTFEDASASGLACRDGEDWRVRSLFQATEGGANDYRMAGGSPELMEAVDASIAGEPFDAAQEKAAMQRGWR